MDSIALANIEVAEKALNCKLPPKLRDFLASLPEQKVELGHQNYCFYLSVDKVETAENNQLVVGSNFFRQQWKLPLVIIAHDYKEKILVLILEEGKEPSDQLYCLAPKKKLIHSFARDIYAAYNGEFFQSSSTRWFTYKLHKNGKVERGQEMWEWQPPEDMEITFDNEYEEMKSKVDDMIDEEKYDKFEQILEQLYILTQQKDHAAWAWWKLSDLFFKGFGPIPADEQRALAYNWNAVLKGHSKSIANRAYCYFKGIGVSADIEKAFALITQANSNTIRGSEQERDGLYYDMLLTIKGAYMKQKKKK
jgi:hypothetical protein